MIDLSLSVSHQAWAVLHHLASYNWSLVETETFAYYDGREKGVLFQTRTGGTEAQFIAVAEHKSSDDIVVYTWDGQSILYGSPPAPPSKIKPKHFKEGRVDQVVKHIMSLLKKADPTAQGA